METFRLLHTLLARGEGRAGAPTPCAGQEQHLQGEACRRKGSVRCDTCMQKVFNSFSNVSQTS